MAVAASILTAAYHMLEEGKTYQDLGPNHFQRRNKDQQKHLLVKRFADLRGGADPARRLAPCSRRGPRYG